MATEVCKYCSRYPRLGLLLEHFVWRGEWDSGTQTQKHIFWSLGIMNISCAYCEQTSSSLLFSASVTRRAKCFSFSGLWHKKNSGGKERPREGGKEGGGGRRKEEKGGGREVILQGLSIFTKRSMEIFIPSWIETMIALAAMTPTFPGCNTDQRWNLCFSKCFPFLL